MSVMNESSPFFDRELSWVAFNGRVLQEAAAPSVPLYERLKFLAIYSSNLDEFFRVRVAGIRSLMSLKKSKREKLALDPAELLQRIYQAVDRQQEEFGRIFRELLQELEAHGVMLIREEEALSEKQMIFLREYFREKISAFIESEILDDEDSAFLRNRALYFTVALRHLKDEDRQEVGMVTIPSDACSRFIELPAPEGEHHIIFLDDAVRFNLVSLFPDHDVVGAYAIKLNRDADLHIEDEFAGDLVKKIHQALQRRETGVPARFLYDPAMPADLLTSVRKRFGLKKEDLFPGGRYHNFHDFFGFPNPLGAVVRDEELPALGYPPFDAAESMFDAVAERSHLLHFPYMRYGPVVRFLEEAASDAHVEQISITLYRVASHSAIAEALIAAAESGKKVNVFMEIKARFDEEANIYWSEKMKEAGVNVMYSFPGLKVHAKLYHIVRRESGKKRGYAFLGTGNFNEKTAGLYCDHGYFTASPEVLKEVAAVFAILAKRKVGYEFSTLLVAQFNLRREFNRLIDREIEHAKAGRQASIIMKMNSLEDPKIIRRLYRASQAGVRITLIIRGICCLVPGVPGISETIVVRSIVDRYLEHARVYVFGNDGDEEVWLASADMMRRNLNRRIEVAFPVREADLRAEILEIIRLQLADNSKARSIDSAQMNTFIRDDSGTTVRAQVDTWRFLHDFHRDA
ncbi:MAG: polyphosphate kinase 1 [Ignavibacteria bacterium]|nr:MAG: polyphosphate kinase 1 [Ignavibacteria bacterium]